MTTQLLFRDYCIAAALVLVTHVAVAQVPVNYIEERSQELQKMGESLQPHMPDPEQKKLLASLQSASRKWFAQYPDELALSLTTIAPYYENLRDPGNFQRLMNEAIALVESPRLHGADPTITVEINYSVMLQHIGNASGAILHLRKGASLAVAAWNPKSPRRQWTLRFIAQEFGQLNDAADAAQYASLANKVDVEEKADLGGTYLEERRAMWRGNLSTFASGGPSPARTAAELELRRRSLDDEITADFGQNAYVNAEEHISLARVLIGSPLQSEAVEELRLAQQSLAKANVSYPDLRIAADEAEADLAIADGHLEAVLARCEDALAVGDTLFVDGSKFSAPLLFHVATLLFEGEYFDRSIVTAERLIHDYSDRAGEADTLVHAEVVLGFSHLRQLQYDLADRDFQSALNIERSLPVLLPTPPAGTVPLSPKQLDEFCRHLLLGPYRKALDVASLNRYLAENDLNTENAVKWHRDADAAVKIMEDTFGPDSPEFLATLDTLIAPAKLALGSREILPLARKLQAHLRSANIHDERERRANDYLGPDHYQSQGDGDFKKIMAMPLNDTADILERDELQLDRAYALMQHGQATAAIDLLKKVIDWRDHRGFQIISDNERLRMRSPDSFVLAHLMTALLRVAAILPANDARRKAIISQAFATAQMLQTSKSEESLQLKWLRSAATLHDNDFKSLVESYERQLIELHRLEGDLAASLAIQPQKAQVQAEALERLRRTQDSLAAKINARASHLGNALPPNYVEAEALERTLHEDEALVLFVFTPRGYDHIWDTGATFIVTRNEIKAVPLCTGTALCSRPGRLFGAVNSYLTFVTPDGGRGQRRVYGTFESTADGPEIGHEIYRAVWGAIDGEFSKQELKISKVSIVPDSYLAYFPFSSLVKAINSKTPDWLVQHYAISYLPTAAALSPHPAEGGSTIGRLVAFADPVNEGYARLPDSAIEACDLAESVSGEKHSFESRQDVKDQVPDWCIALAEHSHGNISLLIGQDATRESAMRMSDAGRLQMLHVLAFASHGILAGDVAHEPGIVLSASKSDPVGFLGISDIARLKLDADVVILSACQTAGSEGMGIRLRQIPTVAEAFTEAGARSVIATFTTVDSEAARVVSTSAIEFSREHPRRSMAEALRQAQLAQIVSGKPPEYWAPFAFFGAP